MPGESPVWMIPKIPHSKDENRIKEKDDRRGRIFMGEALVVTLDNETVRFTPDGRVSVIDAIRAVSNSNRPWEIWERLKIQQPEILIHCEDYSFLTGVSAPVVDSEGLEKILALLQDYLLDPNLP